jgi:predicted kinase
MTRPTMYVMVGLPASGKTTRARQLETEHQALRLTPDEWMIPLFGESDADGKRDVLEGRFVWLATRALRAGLSVILDFGVWGKDERSALRWLAAEAEADCVLAYLSIDDVEQGRRVAARFAAEPMSTFEMRPEKLDAFRRLFQVPDEDELRSSEIDPPPVGHPTWQSWAAERWPTSTS